MTLRRKLGLGVEMLEKRSAPSTLLGFAMPPEGSDLFDWNGDSRSQKRLDRASDPADFELVSKTDVARLPRGASDIQPPSSLLDAGGEIGARGRSHQSGGDESVSHGVTKGTGSVLDFGTLLVIDGASSRILRTPNGVHVSVTTHGLEPGHAYTLWIIPFNSPENCVGGCDVADLANPAALPTFAYGSGHIVGGGGKVTFSASLQEGDTSGFPQDLGDVFPGLEPAAKDLGLIDALSAEIHVVVRDHGPAIPGLVADQVGTFNGGCRVGQPNEGLCFDAQVAVHSP
jgi:hypothetical protein